MEIDEEMCGFLSPLFLSIHVPDVGFVLKARLSLGSSISLKGASLPNDIPIAPQNLALSIDFWRQYNEVIIVRILYYKASIPTSYIHYGIYFL